MANKFSSTADDISDVGARLQEALLRATDELSNDRADHIRKLLARIQELERRGLLNRQKYSVPTTGDFERRFASMQKHK